VPFGSPENEILHFDPTSPKRKLSGSGQKISAEKFKVPGHSYLRTISPIKSKFEDQAEANN